MIKMAKFLKRYWLLIFLGAVVSGLTFFAFKPKKPLVKITTLTITSPQEGALVLIENEPLIEGVPPIHSLPYTTQIEPGLYIIQVFKEGYQTEVRNIKVEKDKENVFSIALERVPNVLFYRLLTEKNTTALGWHNNSLLYAVRDQIKEAEENRMMAFVPKGGTITWDGNNGQALISANQELFHYIPPYKVEKLDIVSSQAILSPSGNKLAYQSNQTIRFITLPQKQTITTLSLLAQESLKELAWSSQENSLGFITFQGQTYTLYLANLTEQTVEKIFANTLRLDNLAFSPNGKHLAFTAGNQLIIYNLSSHEEKRVTPEENLIDAINLWLNESEIILIEKIDQNRVFDKVWLVNSKNGEKTFLAISAPMANRVDFNVKPKLSPLRNAIALAENKGPIWLLLVDAQPQDIFPHLPQLPQQPPYSAP